MEKINPKVIYHVSNIITEEMVKDEALKVVRACFQCGTCTGGCPSGRRTAIRTRQVIRRALLGLDEVLASDDIWLCSTCYTCYERCPRSIPVTDVIIKLRNLASQKGFMKPPHKAVTHILANTGHGVPLGTQKGGEDNNWSLLRASYGLPNIPPTTLSHPECIHDIQVLMHSLEFDTLVDWKPKVEEETSPKAPSEAKKSVEDAKKSDEKIPVPAKDESLKETSHKVDENSNESVKKTSKKRSKKGSKKTSKKKSKKISKKKSKKTSKKESSKKPASTKKSKRKSKKS